MNYEEKMQYYNAGRSVPDNAKKTIPAGKLRGMTDVNPMWRIKKLTEMFGPCGIGWKVVIDKQWTESGEDGRVCAFTDLSLYIKNGDEWSDAIVGVGGAEFTAIEKGSQVSSDEAFKMSFTDAISVCCKMLGIAADVYFEKDRTKYDTTAEDAPQTTKTNPSVTAPALPPVTYADALKMLAMTGKYPDKTLEWIYKNDRAYIGELYKDSQGMLKAGINAIEAYIAECQKKKQ